MTDGSESILETTQGVVRAEVPVGYPTPCYEDCWTARECPDCHRDMNPRGRSAPLEMCCLREPCPADDSRANPRHLWDAADDERYRFWNEDGKPCADALDYYTRRDASARTTASQSSPGSGSGLEARRV